MTPAITAPAPATSTEATADTGIDVVTGASVTRDLSSRSFSSTKDVPSVLTGHPERAQGDSTG